MKSNSQSFTLLYSLANEHSVFNTPIERVYQTLFGYLIFSN